MAKNRKLGRTSDIRKSMLRSLATEVIMYGKLETTETRAKEVRKFVEKMITYGKHADLVSRRKALAFVHNDNKVVEKVFNDLAKRYENRKGGYTQILKLSERRGDDALEVVLRLVEEPVAEEKKASKKATKKATKEAKTEE